MLSIIGTVRNTVKLAQLEQKWQQKKENAGKDEENLTPEEKQVRQYQEDLARMRETNQMSSITSKIGSDTELTPDEIKYLKTKNPNAYREYEEVKREKEAYKNQLKSCKSKEDVEKLKMTKMNEFMAEAKSVSNNPNIPKGKKLGMLEKLLKKVKGIQEVHTEFTKSLEYQSLPTEAEAMQKKSGNDGEESGEVKEIKESSAEDAGEADVNVEEGAEEQSKKTAEKRKNSATFEEAQEVIIDCLKAYRKNGYGSISSLSFSGDSLSRL